MQHSRPQPRWLPWRAVVDSFDEREILRRIRLADAQQQQGGGAGSLYSTGKPAPATEMKLAAVEVTV